MTLTQNAPADFGITQQHIEYTMWQWLIQDIINDLSQRPHKITPALCRYLQNLNKQSSPLYEQLSPSMPLLALPVYIPELFRSDETPDDKKMLLTELQGIMYLQCHLPKIPNINIGSQAYRSVVNKLKKLRNRVGKEYYQKKIDPLTQLAVPYPKLLW